MYTPESYRMSRAIWGHTTATTHKWKCPA